MKQYHDMLNSILHRGTKKPAARKNMPSTTSLFGYQMDEIDLSKGFPLLTTKKIFFGNIITELFWFLKGDTNIKYLNENGFKLWNEDAYNYYLKTVENHDLNYDEFVKAVLNNGISDDNNSHLYKLGDCGYQYGKVWRDFNGVDQISRLIKGLKESPQGRRHIVTATDPGNDHDLALYWCHNMFQFNARPISFNDRTIIGDHYIEYDGDWDQWLSKNSSEEKITKILDDNNVPKYYLDCKLYQRSADVFLGVPYNIASYALLTHLLARIVNMVPGKYVHTFGDLHIYDNHIDQVHEILKNDVSKYKKANLILTPRLGDLVDKFNGSYKSNHVDNDTNAALSELDNFDSFMNEIQIDDIYLDNYKSYPRIKAKLSTGLK